MCPRRPADGQPDDLWLDTTDSTAPFPTLSPGDIGRSALVFNKDTAQFLTVAVAGKDLTALDEEWKFERKAGDPWNGTLHDTWSGLAEYDVRSQLRGLTPRQRDFILQGELARRLSHADFSGIALTPVDDLSIPLTMDAQVATSSMPDPLPAFDVDAYFAPPERNRPLLINNGQKFHLTQTVSYVIYSHGHEPEPPNPECFDQTIAGIHATVLWKGEGKAKGDGGDSSWSSRWTRTAELTVDQPLVAQADYVAVRHMLRDWTDHLKP